MTGGQLSLVGTSTRRRHGYQRGRVEARLVELRADGRPLDTGRASVIRDLADAVDRERARIVDEPGYSSGTLGRLLVELAALWDRWDRATAPPDDVDDLEDDGLDAATADAVAAAVEALG